MSMLLMVKAMNLKVGNPLRKLVLIKLADNANDDGECFPSHNSIARACEISRSSVQSHIEALIKMNIIKKIARKKNDKESTSNLYILTIPEKGEVPSVLGNKNKDKGIPTDNIGGIPGNNIGIPSVTIPIPTDNIGGIPTDEHESVRSFESVIEPIKKINKKSDFDPLTVKPKNVSDKTWNDWINYKNARKKKLQPQSWIAQSRMLEQQHNPEEIINLSIMNGWTGLFPSKSTGLKTQEPPKNNISFSEKNYGDSVIPDWMREE